MAVEGKKNFTKILPPYLFSRKLIQIIEEFYESYLLAVRPENNAKATSLLQEWLKLVTLHLSSPPYFEIYHQAMRTPFDYYQFGLDLIAPLIDFEKSKLLGKENLKAINLQLAKKENVILLANHQTEPDPQIISLLIQKDYPELAQQMVFIAGHRVIQDPLAIPMSLGRNLLCIYSKRHIDHNVGEKSQKILHNQKTLNQLLKLLSIGGYCIYVAPSGGRDRKNSEGIFEVAPFDADSLELFYLLAKQSKCPTHFYPLALKTFPLMPPPTSVEKELGESRYVSYTPVHIAFGNEIQEDNFPKFETKDKQIKRIMRANYIGNLVKKDYHLLLSFI